MQILKKSHQNCFQMVNNKNFKLRIKFNQDVYENSLKITFRLTLESGSQITGKFWETSVWLTYPNLFDGAQDKPTKMRSASENAF